MIKRLFDSSEDLLPDYKKQYTYVYADESFLR